MASVSSNLELEITSRWSIAVSEFVGTRKNTEAKIVQNFEKLLSNEKVCTFYVPNC